MQEFFDSILANHVLLVSLSAWFIAQLIKVLIDLVAFHRLDLKRLTGAGGMPSSHTALATALAFSVGKAAGWDSVIFAVAGVVAGIVMYDAAGVRRAAGKQAEAINQIIGDVYRGKQISQDRLKELIGHTPFEVLVGALLGVFIAAIF